MSFFLSVNSAIPMTLGASKGKPALRKVINALTAAISGTGREFDDWLVLNNVTGAPTGNFGRACAVGVCGSSTTGTIGLVINGTSVTVTSTEGEVADAALIAAAINANTTVNPFVTATSYVGSLTLATVVAGTIIDVCGYKFTATAAATGKPFEFSISGDDTADALALSIAINSAPGLCSKVRAVSVAAVCYIGLVEDRAARSDEKLRGMLSTGAAAATVTVAQIAASAVVMVTCRFPGVIGNTCTLTATGTGVTAGSAVSGKLGGGLGGYSSTAGVAQYLTQDTR